MIRRLMLAVSTLVLGAFVMDARAADDENPVVTLVKTKVKDQNKPFGMAVIFKVKSGMDKDFETAFIPCAKATRKEPGCLSYAFNKDVDEENTYVVYEQFKSVAALEDHGKSKHVGELLKKIGTMLDGDPKVKVFTLIGAE